MLEDLSSEDYQEQFASGEGGEYQLIDVREEEEHATAHIPGAINIPLSAFSERLDDISEDMPVLLVCNTGVRSLQAAYFLMSMGYDQLYNLEDGTKGWQKKGYAVKSAYSP